MERDAGFADRGGIVVVALSLEGHLVAGVLEDFRGGSDGQFPDRGDAVLCHIFSHKGATREGETGLFQLSNVGDGHSNFVLVVAVVLELEADFHLIALGHGAGALVRNIEVDHAEGGDVQVAAHGGIGSEGLGPIQHADVGDRC